MYCCPTGPACWRNTGRAALTWCSADTPTGDRCACRLQARCSPRTRACLPNTAGVYQAGETRMVVSRGLGNGTPYPRLWNGPELVVVTMKRAGT